MAADCDARVALRRYSSNDPRKKSDQMELYIHRIIAKRCGWQRGDRVLVDFDETTGRWILTRSNDPDAYRLSITGGQRSRREYNWLSVKFTVTDEDSRVIFPNGVTSKKLAVTEATTAQVVAVSK
jgi:anaerobic selenocysteine-containing dehydrogenase